LSHARLVLVVVLCAVLGIVAKAAHPDRWVKAVVHEANHTWHFASSVPKLRRYRLIARHDRWVLHANRFYHFRPSTVSFHRRELKHALAHIRALAPRLTWWLVGATEYGGARDPGTGSYGHCGNLYDHPWSFAELVNNTALGTLPFYSHLAVRNPLNGATIVLEKCDAGYGQGSTAMPGGGGIARLDLWFQAADAIGFGGYGSLLISDAPRGWALGPR
jgi:hypothetical protein